MDGRQYSTHLVSQPLIDEIVYALQTVHAYGSIEIYVQNSTVTQITVRNIKKTSMSIEPSTRDKSKTTIRFTSQRGKK
jgi:hypothetical protein